MTARVAAVMEDVLRLPRLSVYMGMARTGTSTAGADTAEAFTTFVVENGPRLKQSLISALGGEMGREATSDALTWAWEHWDRIEMLDNPAGYLYRLARNRSVSYFRRRPNARFFSEISSDDPIVEPGLGPALARLSEMQRLTVLLIHGFGWTYREVADHLGVATGTVQIHAKRGMTKLRTDLKVDTDA